MYVRISKPGKNRTQEISLNIPLLMYGIERRIVPPAGMVLKATHSQYGQTEVWLDEGETELLLAKLKEPVE